MTSNCTRIVQMKEESKRGKESGTSKTEFI